MGFLDRLLDWIQYLWPLHKVQQWEQGGYYEGGKFVRVLGPGIWLIVPWFTEIRNVSIVPDIVYTSKLDITLSDGSVVTFVAEADYIVNDAALALNAVNDFHHRTSELLAGVLSDRLAQESHDDVKAGVRKRLLTSLKNEVNKQCADFGVEVKTIWFASFITKVRVLRVVTDGGNVL